MFGFYDPKSLEISGRSAAIDFINIDDGAVTRKTFEGAEGARSIARALDGQKKCGISSDEKTIREIRGSIVFLPDHPDEALIAPEENPKRTIPAKMGFDVDPGDLPSNGYAIIHGVPVDGAMVVCKMAMKSYAPTPATRPEGAAETGPE